MENISQIQNRIFTVRGVQAMLDSDLARLYKVETKALNRAVKRNIERFPDKFRFQLTKDEYQNLRFKSGTSKDVALRFQNDTSSSHGGRRYLPYAFTEQGVSMLSAVLRSKTAIHVSIKIMDAFVEMRKFIANNATLFQRLEKVELKQVETDQKLTQIFEALENKSLKPRQGIFYNGQIYDAYTFVSSLIRSANKSLVLIDNYIDDSVLTLLTKRIRHVIATIYTKRISRQLALDLQKHNAQYPDIALKVFPHAHDRFLIIDGKELYHIGASLKDLGKNGLHFQRWILTPYMC